MAIINDYGFPFTSVSADRQYSASEFREYFAILSNNGVLRDYLNGMAVAQLGTPAKAVQVATGAVFINGALFSPTTVTQLAVAENTSGNPRIDRIVARLDTANRKILLAVVQGTPAASPSAPSLTRTSATWELSLAQVYLANGYSTILNANITDERADDTVCGYIEKTFTSRRISSGTGAPSGGIDGDIYIQYD